MTTKDIIRRCRFTPYRKGAGPSFALTMWATGRADSRGQTIIGYTLTSGGKVVFTGEDFAGSPMHADDSDATVAALMGFLTLKPGDTDRDYFANYTAEQMSFAETHADALAMEVMSRFGESF